MINDAIANICYPSRTDSSFQESLEDITSFIESRTLPYPSQLEDDFASRALKLGVESGMVLDVGTRVGLAALKLLWQNENFYSIGIDSSGPMIEHARAWHGSLASERFSRLATRGRCDSRPLTSIW
jgi:SAM-dependent methyltransferase